MTETDTRNGAIGGHIGSRATRDTTFHGNDPHTVAADSICRDTPTHCQARTRLYRNGQLVEQGFAIERISDHLGDPTAIVWLDLRAPDHDDLLVLQEEFGLHPVAIEDALVIGMAVCQHHPADVAPTNLGENAGAGPACAGIHQHVLKNEGVEEVLDETTELPNTVGDALHEVFRHANG